MTKWVLIRTGQLCRQGRYQCHEVGGQHEDILGEGIVGEGNTREGMVYHLVVRDGGWATDLNHSQARGYKTE